MMHNKSEVAQLRQRIAAEYQSAQWGLTGLAYGTSQHEFITTRMENMGKAVERLTQVVGSPEEVGKVMVEMFEALPERPTRLTLVGVLRHELEQIEETTILIKHIQEMWETMDGLSMRFGAERAQKIIETPSFLADEGGSRG